MGTAFNILVTVAGATAAVSAVNQIKGGLADVTQEGAKATASAMGLGQVATVAGAAALAIGSIKESLELGGKLNDLSARTGQSVHDLVILRQAFTASGIGADGLGIAINRLQKALGGVNEMGQSTEMAFRKLGVSAESLRGSNALEQFQALSSGFSQIQDPSERAAVAMELFGREGAQMLQLLGDSRAIAQAADDAGDLADRMQRNAATFDEAGDRVEALKLRFMDAAAAATEQLLPVLNSTVSLVAKLGAGKVGAVAGSVAPIAAAAGIAIKTVDYLEKAGPKWQKSLEGGTFAGLSTGIEATTGFLAKVLPIGLAAAVAAAIVVGITAAMIESDKREIDAENAKAKVRHDRISKIQSARSTDEQDKVIEEMQRKLDELDSLGKTQELYPRVRARSDESGIIIEEGRDAVYGLNADQRKEREQLTRDIAAARSPESRAAVDRNLDNDAQKKRLAEAQAILELMRKQVEASAQQAAQSRYNLANDQAKLALLKEQEANAAANFEAESAAAATASSIPDAVNAQLRYTASLLGIEERRREVLKSIASSTEKAAADAKKEEDARKKELQERLRLQLDTAKNKLEEQQLEISRQSSLLEADYTRTDAEKWQEKVKLNQQALQAAQAYLAKLKEIAAVTPAENRAAADANVLNAQKDVYAAQKTVDSTGPAPTDFDAQMLSMAVTAQNSIGTIQQQMTGMWSGMAQDMRTNMGSALNDMVWESGSAWGKIQGFGLATAKSLTAHATQMAADWIWSHLIMANVRSLFEAQATAGAAAGSAARAGIRATETGHDVANTGVQVGAHVAAETTKTGSTLFGSLARGAVRVSETIFHAAQCVIRVGAHLAAELAQTTVSVAQTAIRIPLMIAESMGNLVKAGLGALSAMSSIPYVGPFLGIAAMAAVIAAGTSLIGKIGHHENGGGVRGGQQLSWLNENGEEFVFSAPAVRAIGMDRLEALHSAARSGRLGYDSVPERAGSVAGSGSSGGSNAGGIILVDNRREAARISRASDAEDQIIDLVRRNKWVIAT